MAQFMLDRGFEIFPLSGKAPAIPTWKGGKGFHDSTRDHRAIAEWANTYPGSNWGGRRRNTLCVDVDPRNGGLVDDLGLELDETLVIRTGSGGWHIYYDLDMPGSKIQKTWPGQDGVDLKHYDTGYTVLPGSVHPETLGRYAIYSGADVARAPQWLLNKIERVEKPRPEYTGEAKGDISGLVRTVLDSVSGERNNVLFWAAATCAAEGYDMNEIRNAALSVGLKEYEIDRTIQSAERAAQT